MDGGAGSIELRTCRILDCPGDAPKPVGDAPLKLMVWSLRKVKVPGPEGAGTLELFSLGAECPLKTERSG